MKKNRYVQSYNTIVERCSDGSFVHVVLFRYSWEAKTACKALNKAWRDKERRCKRTYEFRLPPTPLTPEERILDAARDLPREKRNAVAEALRATSKEKK